jgi:hypothetical protein
MGGAHRSVAGKPSFLEHRGGWTAAERSQSPDSVGRRRRFKDRQAREAKEREKRKGAAAKQTAADRQLRNQLLAACRGNFTPGPGLDDMAPVWAILELVRVDYILYAIRQKVDKRCFPVTLLWHRGAIEILEGRS